MTESGTPAQIAELADDFVNAPTDQVDERFRRLTGALWDDGVLTDLALPAVPALVARLDKAADDRKGHLAVLLGVLAEAEFPDTTGPVATAVRAGLDRYLELLAQGADRDPLTLGLVYLLAHFPADRERILAAVPALSPDDLTRLVRLLTPADQAHADLGRVWPSPSVWGLGESEKDFDNGWISALTPEQFTAAWRNDQRTLFGHAGAKAYWAARHGSPAEIVAAPVPDPETLEAGRTAAVGTGLFGRHAAALRCPNCHEALAFAGGVTCTGCATAFPVADGILDLMPGERVAPGDEDTGDALHKLAAMPSMGLYYEAVLRPAFLRAMGSNWDEAVTPADEDRYIAEHVDPAEGPVLDLAAGAGRWTAVLAGAVGPERLVALDVSVPMLAALRVALPEVPALQASALELPFEDGSLGAVLCWNALQALPDAAAGIAEVGRCLRPGGTFTLLTFRWGDDALYSYFQHAHRFPNAEDGMRLFGLDELRGWLAAAGMRIRDESGSGTFVFLTAERVA
ncbi:Methyltransferase domain-containing protein [Amycolatopsis pretoriensis]|uniref:Methyltransferase domain-containing protein n=1 Tax=Amycolatopsis pretoriensis TaxID=218821 RepID=A0A1H5R4G3_9PSEU|nr:class I SAM-dependent methyltransferase [Amycolatopsis pretoriensis]SEF33265.1 Methyltransferase domain-containing protein [Amycolatopsis pretoriensis]